MKRRLFLVQQLVFWDYLILTFAYTDLREATVKRAAADWYDLTYNDENLNIIIEKYVDADGNEIAKSGTSQGKENHAYHQFDKHYYLDYITEITHVYSDGATRMSGTKTMDKSTAAVGDTLNYSSTVSNGKKATATLENVIVNDVLSEYMAFFTAAYRLMAQLRNIPMTPPQRNSPWSLARLPRVRLKPSHSLLL